MSIQVQKDAFITNLEQKGRATSTVVAYKKDIEQLIEFLDSQNIKDVNDLNSKVLNDYIQHLNKVGTYSLKTISRKINSLKTFSKYLYDENLIDEDYGKSVEHPKLEMKSPRVLSSMEYRALRDTIKDNLRLYTMVELLLQTGIRIGELSRLKRSDIDIENNQLNIQKFSSNNARTVELNITATSALEKYLTRTPPSKHPANHLFYTKSGKPILIRNIRTTINRAFKKTGIQDATVNDIRNTFIIFQLTCGVDINKLADQVGHKKSSTTERYLAEIPNIPTKKLTNIQPL